MTLDSSSLADGLEALFASMPGSASDAADGMASAYYDYASAGMFGANTPVVPVSNETALAATILAAIADPDSGAPSTLASAWDTGLAAFWAAVPVTGAQTGTTVPPAATAAAAIQTTLSNTNNSAADAASGLASALHTATLTVTATVTPPAGTILPIT